jgi:hypothetical protein
VIIPWRNHHGGRGGQGEVAELMSANANANNAPSRNATKGSRSPEMSDYPNDVRHVESTPNDEYRDDDDDVVVIDGISGAPVPPRLLSHLDHLHMASRLAPF